MAVFSAAGTVALGLLNVFGAGTGRVMNVISALILVAAFLFTLRKALGDDFGEMSQRRRLGYIAGAVVLALVLLVVGIATRAAIPLNELPGARDVAIVGIRAPSKDQQRVYDDVAANLARSLPISSDSLVYDYSAAVDPPLSEIAQLNNAGKLDEWVADFVSATDAELVVAGYADEREGMQTAVHIAVFVPDTMVEDVPELSGWYLLDDVLLDRSLESAGTRRDLMTGVSGQLQGLMTFLAGLDMLQAGHADEAVTLFDKTTATGSTNPEGTLEDLSLLFRGHAIEAQARREPLGSKEYRRLLAAAREDYQSVPADSVVAARVKLSLATNKYLQVIQDGCNAVNPSMDQLAWAAITLKQMGADGALPRLTRLKAEVNRAQVDDCRRRAGVPKGELIDEAAIHEIATAARRESEVDPNPLPKRQIAALANSILATRFASRGDYEAALATINQALELEPRFELQATWRGQASQWLISLCRLDEAKSAQAEAVRQLRVAVERGRADAQYAEDLAAAFEKDLSAARERCSGNEKGRS